MVKNILAFFGLVFLTLIILVGVGVIGYFYDSVGLVSIPKEFFQKAAAQISGDAAVLPMEVTLSVADGPLSAEWSNPLDLLPDVTPMPLPTATPVPTATAVPPLDPLVYRAETLVRLKEFVRALENWLAINDRAAAKPGLLEDSDWQEEVMGALNLVVERATALSAVGPAPDEYSGMDVLFERVQDEAENMHWFMEEGLASRDPRALNGAGESFTRLKDYLTQAVNAMISAGWSLE